MKSRLIKQNVFKRYHEPRIKLNASNKHSPTAATDKSLFSSPEQSSRRAIVITVYATFVCLFVRSHFLMICSKPLKWFKPYLIQILLESEEFKFATFMTIPHRVIMGKSLSPFKPLLRNCYASCTKLHLGQEFWSLQYLSKWPPWPYMLKLSNSSSPNLLGYMN